jgi:hypothetical protein
VARRLWQKHRSGLAIGPEGQLAVDLPPVPIPWGGLFQTPQSYARPVMLYGWAWTGKEWVAMVRFETGRLMFARPKL